MKCSTGLQQQQYYNCCILQHRAATYGSHHGAKQKRASNAQQVNPAGQSQQPSQYICGIASECNIATVTQKPNELVWQPK